jgi:hypothetical protein
VSKVRHPARVIRRAPDPAAPISAICGRQIEHRPGISIAAPRRVHPHRSTNHWARIALIAIVTVPLAEGYARAPWVVPAAAPAVAIAVAVAIATRRDRRAALPAHPLSN